MFVDKLVLFQLFIVLISWFTAQLIKIFLGYSSFSKKELFSTSGGMPSAHTASISAFFFSELFFNGLTSITALSAILMVVIIVDALGVRHQSGINAIILANSIKDKKVKEKVILKQGHKKIEVFAGFILGFVVSLIGYFVLGAFL